LPSWMRDCLIKAAKSSSDLTEILPLKMLMSLAALAAVINSSHLLNMSVIA